MIQIFCGVKRKCRSSRTIISARNPAGDFVILTFEGDDPEASFAQIMQNMPADFAEFVKDVHGLDVNAPPPTNAKTCF